MRYAHMVRQYEGPLDYDAYPPRRFSPLPFSKRAITFALDLRQRVSSFRPNPVLLLITAPFIIALLLLFIRPRSDSLPATFTDTSPTITKFKYDPMSNDMSHYPNRSRDLITLPNYLDSLKQRRNFTIQPGEGVSLIAACKNRKESLSLSLPSWDAIDAISEIIIVDWGSNSTYYDLPHFSAMIQSGRLAFVRVNDDVDWVLSRAYNLAARIATGEFMVKVDCDTHLRSSFFTDHSFTQPNVYYTVSWGSERNKYEEKLRGVWYARTSDFRNVSGYDERISAYGYEDVDLYRRFRKDALLKLKPFNLNTLHHNIAGHVLWGGGSLTTSSHRVSVRMNEAVQKASERWSAVVKTYSTAYNLSFDNTEGILFADIHSLPPDPQAHKSREERDQLKREVLEKALHDEFHIPWDILPSLKLEDLEYLASYSDSHVGSHLLFVCLDGPDTLSNTFNLVSALQLGMSTSRPVIVIWKAPGTSEVDQSDGPILEQLFDLPATNKLISAIMQKDVENGHSGKGTRIIAARRWPCVEALSECGKKYDEAYSSFSELAMRTPRVYDDKEPLPLSVKLHGFIRLSNLTKIGNTETRTYAYNSLVQSDLVRDAQQALPQKAELGIISSSNENVSSLAAEVRQTFSEAVVDENVVLPIVGIGHHELRRELFGLQNGGGYCESGKCDMIEMARELANVVSMLKASTVFPESSDADQSAWMKRRDVTNMMVADLRELHSNGKGSL